MAAWITAATTARQTGVVIDAGSEDRSRVTASMAGPNPAVLELREEVSRLRDRLVKASIPQETARNPFLLAPLGATGVMPASEPERLSEAQSMDLLSAPAPEATLVGLAVDGDSVTAILTLPAGEVLLVGVGDKVPGGYQVERVDPRGVTLGDADGGSHRLPLP